MRTPPPDMTWFIGVEVEQETSAPPPKKNPGSAPVFSIYTVFRVNNYYLRTLKHGISIVFR